MTMAVKIDYYNTLLEAVVTRFERAVVISRLTGWFPDCIY